jgi:carbon monoxide dehydrogenase subunit G
MTRLSEQVASPVDRETAFAYVADFARQAEWDPNTESSRRIDVGPMGVGARFALEVRIGPRRAPMEYRITEFEPPSRVVLVGEGSGVWSRDEISFTETGEGTRVDYVAEIRLSGLLGLVQPLLGRAFTSVGRNAVAGMKRQLDALALSGPAVGAGSADSPAVGGSCAVTLSDRVGS